MTILIGLASIHIMCLPIPHYSIVPMDKDNYRIVALTV